MPNDQESLVEEHDAQIDMIELPAFDHKKLFKEIIQLSFSMMSSDTHAMKAIFLAILLKLSSTEEDDPAVNLAAYALISAYFNTLLVVSVSPLFGINLIASVNVGQAQNPENDRENESKKEITALFRNSLLYTAAVVPLIAPLLYESGYLYPSYLKMRNFKAHQAANMKCFSIEKFQNAMSIPTIFLNQNMSSSCPLNLKIPHLQVRWV